MRQTVGWALKETIEKDLDFSKTGLIEVIWMANTTKSVDNYNNSFYNNDNNEGGQLW